MGAWASMLIDPAQLIHGHDTALPLYQHEWPVREGRGEEEKQDSRALGRTSLPLLRASLAIQLGEILFRGTQLWDISSRYSPCSSASETWVMPLGSLPWPGDSEFPFGVVRRERR